MVGTTDVKQQSDRADRLDKEVAALREELHSYRKMASTGVWVESLKYSQLIQDNFKLYECLRWYDGVHRLHWAIDLNELSKKASETLAGVVNRWD